jgi:hypothetical protein
MLLEKTWRYNNLFLFSLVFPAPSFCVFGIAVVVVVVVLKKLFYKKYF